MYRPESKVRRWLRLAGDLAIACGAFYLAFLIRIYVPLPWTDTLLPRDRLAFFVAYWPLVTLAQPVALYFFGLYDPPHPRSGLELGRRLSPAIVSKALALGAFFFLAERTFPRSVLVVFVALDAGALLLWRLYGFGGRTAPRVRVAIIGCGPNAAELADRIVQNPGYGVELAGWVAVPGEEEAVGRELRLVRGGSGPAAAPSAIEGPGRAPVAELGPRLGTVDDLPRLMGSGAIDEVVIAESESRWKTRLLDRLAAASDGGRGSVLLLPSPFDSLIGRMRYRWVYDIPLIEVVRDSEWRLFRPVKRAFDLAVGSLLLLLALPILALCALAIRFTSPGPILYRQQRIGRGLRPFTLWKLRTMVVDAERDGEMLASPGDQRVTPIGAVLRAFRLDELPQLVNVLSGAMSLVGPRPERPGFVEQYLEEIPGYAERFAIPPGLTGLAQVSGEYLSTPQNKLRSDLAYVANWSLWLDVAILVRTGKIMLTSRGL